MIEILSCYASLKLDPIDFARVLKGMNAMGYKSVIWQSKVALLATAGITDLNEDMLKWISYYRVDNTESFIYRADIFVEGNEIVYILDRRTGFYSFDYKVEIGIITENLNDAYRKLHRYTAAFSAALKSNLDGRKVRHMNKNWYKYSENENIRSKATFEGNYVFSSLLEEEITASSHVSDITNRKVLLRIAESGRLKRNDIKERIRSYNLVLSIGLLNSY